MASPPMRKRPLSRPSSRTVLSVLVVIGEPELSAVAVRVDVDHDGLALPEIAVDEPERQRILNQPLNGAAHRTGAVLRVITLGDDDVLSGGSDFELQFTVPKQFAHVRQLNV